MKLLEYLKSKVEWKYEDVILPIILSFVLSFIACSICYVFLKETWWIGIIISIFVAGVVSLYDAQLYGNSIKYIIKDVLKQILWYVIGIAISGIVMIIFV